LTSQAHELLQRTARQARSPLQFTEHFPVPQATSEQVFFVVQSTEHEVVPAHVTPLPHAPSTLHLTAQAQPAGHATLAAQFVAAQSMVHVWVAILHDVHLPGQPSTDASIDPGTMQNPFTHSRPELQSRCELHA
jgi:hypothetical protein